VLLTALWCCGAVCPWCSLTAVPQELADAPKLKVLVLDPNPFSDKKLTKVHQSAGRWGCLVGSEMGAQPVLVDLSCQPGSRGTSVYLQQHWQQLCTFMEDVVRDVVREMLYGESHQVATMGYVFSHNVCQSLARC
jgi:hypothetical protein